MSDTSGSTQRAEDDRTAEAMPRVAIVGRPNVGKSSIFNWLARRRIAIVDDFAGVTRDRLTHVIRHGERYFEIVDTGGMGVEDVDDLTQQIEGQIAEGIHSADIIIFVVDAQTGILPLDRFAAQRLRRQDKCVLCVANKADSPSWDCDVESFRQLGHGAPLCISTTANRHREELLDAIIKQLADTALTAPTVAPAMKLTIVGRRNVGKSTFVNALAQSERMIVSEVPGTTRDSVDVHFQLDRQTFVAIDTPGIRRGKSVRTDIDFYGTRRAQRSIRRCDVALLFFDARHEVSKIEKQLCSYIADQYKPCLFVVNKWDLVRERSNTEDWASYLHESLPNMEYVPIAFITAKTGKNVKTLVNHAQMLFKQARERAATGRLNSLVRDALRHHPPPLVGNRRPKIFYAAQIATQPPTIALVCNSPQYFSPDYRRYLMNVMRDQLRFREVPIRLFLNARSRDDTRDDIGESE